MKKEIFTATTKSGIIVEVTAENTMEELKTTYPVMRIKADTDALSLSPSQALDLLGVTLSIKQPAAYVLLDDQAGWESFRTACLKERYDAEQARPKSLEEQREVLANTEYDLYSPEHFPTSKAYARWMDATQALKEFDAAHPEIKANIKTVNDGFIPTEGSVDL